jgi:tetratricopeptide (TPR) repeat protein
LCSRNETIFPRRISKEGERKINKDIVRKFLDVIKANNFWQLPSPKEVSLDQLAKMSCNDCTISIVEGLSNGHYHLVDNYSGEISAARIRLYFFKLSGFNWEDCYLDGAISGYTKRIEIAPKFARIYIDRGIAYRAKGQYGKSISDFNKAIELNWVIYDAEAYYNRALTYYYKGQHDKASTTRPSLISTKP